MKESIVAIFAFTFIALLAFISIPLFDGYISHTADNYTVEVDNETKTESYVPKIGKQYDDAFFYIVIPVFLLLPFLALAVNRGVT